MTRLERFFLWLGYWLFGKRCYFCQHLPLPYFLLTIIDQHISITGERLKMKAEFGFKKTFEATPVGGTSIEAGSAQWSYVATDASGNDVSEQFQVTVDEANELRATVEHDGTPTESVGVLTLRADGDPDADEEAPVVGTATIVLDSPNVTAFEINEVPTAPTPEPTPEPTPVETDEDEG